MDSFESSTNSFVVKVWLEEVEHHSDMPLWRGHITHIPSNDRRYVQDLESIAKFIASYLHDMGIEGEHLSSGIQGWLQKRSVN